MRACCVRGWRCQAAGGAQRCRGGKGLWATRFLTLSAVRPQVEAAKGGKGDRSKPKGGKGKRGDDSDEVRRPDGGSGLFAEAPA